MKKIRQEKFGGNFYMVYLCPRKMTKIVIDVFCQRNLKANSFHKPPKGDRRQTQKLTIYRHTDYNYTIEKADIKTVRAGKSPKWRRHPYTEWEK